MSKISHQTDQNPHVYAPNCYHATSRGAASFPEIRQLTKQEYKDSQHFRVNRAVVTAGVLLGVALSISTAAAITFALGVLAPIVIPGAIAAAVFGTGSLCTLAASSNLSRIFIKQKDVYRVRWPSGHSENNTNQPASVQAFAARNGKESFEWKKKLIESANNRIVLSGNYCGGTSFDEILNLMEACLEKKPNLKIVILTSPKFLSKENQTIIARLTSKYTDRFQIVETPDKWMDSEQGLKKITNHTKGLVVDGTHCIMGGSGIEDKYAYYEGIGDQGAEKTDEEGGFLKFFLPRGFRDMDFVFSGADLGKKLDQELLQLARIWEHYNDNKGTNKNSVNTSVAGKMLSEEILPDAEPARLFASETGLQMADGQCEIICSGPEMVGSPYGERVMEEVEKATESIYIDHMYFHPTRELEDLLVKKVNEGVKLFVVTNGAESFTPKGHLAFGPRSRYRVASIAARVNESCRKNIEMYEFGQPYDNTPKNTTLHKKVMVIDRKVVVAGSSNLGYKSTVTSSDHEINFVMSSEAFAEQTIAVIEEDAYKIVRKAEKQGSTLRNESNEEVQVPLSQKVEDPRRYYTLRNRLLAWRHRRMAWLIG